MSHRNTYTTFPYTDSKSFVALAAILEGVGVGVYNGASVDVSSPDHLNAAASILTIEARHASYIRAESFPAPFDTALDYDQVFSLDAGLFVSSPSSNPQLGVKPFSLVGVSMSGTIQSGATVTLLTAGYVLANFDASGNAPIYGAFLSSTRPIFQPATKVSGGHSVTVPQAINGQTCVVLTACSDKVKDETTLAGPALLEVQNLIIQATP